MRSHSIVFTSLLVGLGAAGGCKNKDKDKDAQWQEQRTYGGYTFEMPGLAKSKSEAAPLGAGLTTFEVKSGGREYIVWLVALNDGLTFDHVKGTNAFASAVKGSVTSLTDYTFNELSGKAFEIDTNDKSGRVIGRAVRTSSRSLYIIAVAGPNVQGSDADVQRFFGSMKKNAQMPSIVLEKSPPPAAKTPDNPSGAKTPTRLEQHEIALEKFATKFLKEIGQKQYANAYNMLSPSMREKETQKEFMARIKKCDALSTFKSSIQTYSKLIIADDRGGTVTAICEGEQKATATVILDLLSIKNQRMTINAMEIKENQAP